MNTPCIRRSGRSVSALALLAVLASACSAGSHSSTSVAATPPTRSSAAPVPTSPAASPTSSRETTTGGVDPCAFVRPADAAAEMGATPSIGPKEERGPAGPLCRYSAGDPANPNGFSTVVVAIFSTAGTAGALDAAASRYPGAQPLPGVGDRAYISEASGFAGVLVNRVIFTLTILRDGAPAPATIVRVAARTAATRAAAA